MALLEIENVTRRFGSTTAVDGVSLSIEAGEFFTLLGPSGCGKTTLLRMIAGFDPPDGGRIVLAGQDLTDVPPERRPVRTVFQSYALFPHMTVAANVVFPLRMAKVAPAEIPSRVAAALEDVRLQPFANRFPHELSGGQRQRVAIARALVTKPKLMLLDEPLAALDAKLRGEMQIELINLQKEVGITFIYVTHDQTEALALSHRIAVMNQGRIEQLDEPSKIYSFPANRFVADFIGECNILSASVQACEDGVCTLDLAGIGSVRATINVPSVAPGTAGALALRPEKIAINAPGQVAPDGENHLSGRVMDFLYQGDVTIYMVELASGARLEAMRPNSASGRARFFDVGDAVDVAWKVDAGHFLAD
ncbi:MAG TPA: ABC transporter ATP-binding protein [Burkholderiaceae bacterium]|nr:ABC transporter ATP-binding protein [Burkholderiaceae bacterium]